MISKVGFILLLSGAILSCASNGSEDSGSAESAIAAPADTSSPQDIPNLTPAGNKPEWGPSITNNMLVVIEKLQSLGGKPIEKLSADEARKQPTPAQAVMQVMKEHNISMPAPMSDTTGKEIPVKGGTIHARIYTPRVANDKYPLIVYFHGGGWVIADLDTYDASPKALAEQTGAVVVSVHYRQGPEHKFPVAHNDAFSAYEWVLKNANQIKGDTSSIAVVGESAGGNLACNVSIMARDRKIKMPLYQVLVYPVANHDMNSESYNKYATAKPLNKAMMAWFAKNYLPTMNNSSDNRFSLVKADLKNLPPTTIIAAEIDPLQSEGKQLSEQLNKAGVKTEYKMYDGVTHEFFGMASVLTEAKRAQKTASDAITNGFQR